MTETRQLRDTAFRPQGGALNFSGVNRMLPGKAGYKGAAVDGIAATYVGEKPGGSVFGHLVDINNRQHIVKTSTSFGLLGYALNASVEGKADFEKHCLSLIVFNFTRIAGSNASDHPKLLKELKKCVEEIPSPSDFANLLTGIMLAALNEFKKTEAGIAILDKLKRQEKLHISDVYSIGLSLTNNNEVLRNIIGLASFSDLINGACGQFFNNVYQERFIPREMLDDHHLLIEQNDNPNMFLASRFNSTAIPFDNFMLLTFLNSKLDDENAWLETFRRELSAKITNLHGLGSAILLRLIMGESADLGPDNMLVVQHNDAQYIMNIDVTGMRYPRRNIFNDSKKGALLGWESILTSDNPEYIKNALFDKSVFTNRFVADNRFGSKYAKEVPDNMKNKVMETIIEVLKSKIDTNELYKEVLDLRAWLQMQMLDGAIKTLEATIMEAYNSLNPACKPYRSYIEKLIKHDKSFIQDCVQIAQAMLQPAQVTVFENKK